VKAIEAFLILQRAKRLSERNENLMRVLFSQRYICTTQKYSDRSHDGGRKRCITKLTLLKKFSSIKIESETTKAQDPRIEDKEVRSEGDRMMQDISQVRPGGQYTTRCSYK